MSIFNSFRFEVVHKNKVKISYTGNENLSVAIGFQLIGTNIQNYFYLHTFTPYSWTIPSYSLIGIEKIYFYEENSNKYLFEWLVPKLNVVTHDKSKIVCIGLNKTGTTSFQKGLEKLGLSFFPDYTALVNLTPSFYHGDIRTILSVLDNPKFDAYEDMPFALPSFFKKIYEYRPNDIYVLTVRENTEKWVESFKKYHDWLIRDGLDIQNNIHPLSLSVQNVSIETNLKNFITPLFEEYGLFSDGEIDLKLRNLYENYNREVIEFFKNKPKSKFIVLDVSKNGELKRFTDWIDLKNDVEDFPWENKTK